MLLMSEGREGKAWEFYCLSVLPSLSLVCSTPIYLRPLAVSFVSLLTVTDNVRSFPKPACLYGFYRVAHEKSARRLVDQRGRRSRTLYRKLNKCKCKVLTG